MTDIRALAVGGLVRPASSVQWWLVGKSCRAASLDSFADQRPVERRANVDHQVGAVGFAQCMRAHGVPKWPDPDSSGVVRQDEDHHATTRRQ